MGHKSFAQQRKELCRELIRPDRWIAARLEVVAPDGEFIFAVGGCWDSLLACYVDRPAVARRVKLKLSQVPMARAMGAWIIASLNGDDARPAVLLGIGNRGSGKTWALGLFLAAIALAFPSEYQQCLNIVAKGRREVLDAIRQVMAPEWITLDVADFRDARTEFITGAGILWLSSKNPSAMRMAQLKFRHVAINEGQDQPLKIFTNASGAVRAGGCVTVVTNSSQGQGGDWVVNLYDLITAGEKIPEMNGADGAAFVLDNKDNDVVDQPVMGKLGRLVKGVDPAGYEADFLGLIKLSGQPAYPLFSRHPAIIDDRGTWSGGHVGVAPPIPDIGSPLWEDVTRELTAAKLGEHSPFDWIAGTDFQGTPGCCASPGKLYRRPDGVIVFAVREFIGVKGLERDLSAALSARGYAPGPVDFDSTPAPGRSLLLIGDATGSTQAADHVRGNPYSFTVLGKTGEGWTIIGPYRHAVTRKWHNPPVVDSRRQMGALFSLGAILIAPECNEAANGFPSLIDAFKRCKCDASNERLQKSSLARPTDDNHGPDTIRYPVWCFLPRNNLHAPLAPHDSSTFDLIRGTRLFTTE